MLPAAWTALLLALLGVPAAPLLHAADIKALSCSQADVLTAIEAAASGDRVLVPAGSCTWTASVAVPDAKTLVIQGAGKDDTIITLSGQTSCGSLPAGVGTCGLTLGTSGSRVTGFTWKFGASPPSSAIVARGQYWRVHGNHFENDTAVTGINNRVGVFATWGSNVDHPRGLVDNNTFLNSRVNMGTLATTPTSGGVGGLGGASYDWAQPLNLGGDRAVFVEDNTFTRTTGTTNNVIDSNYGARYVFRHNTVICGGAEAHSVQGNNRSSRSWEIYNNDFHSGEGTPCASYLRGMFLRGGTGVVFGNTFTGAFTTPIALDNVRSAQSNLLAAGHIASAVRSGNTVVLTTQQQHNIAAGASVVVADVGDPSFNGTFSNVAVTSTTVTYEQPAEDATSSGGTVSSGIPGACTGHPEKLLSLWDGNTEGRQGWPCRDQIGRSTDEFLWTAETPYPPQASDPARFWGNTYNGDPVHPAVVNTGNTWVVGGSSVHIVQDRDFISSADDSAKPQGYTPYTYPHPLRMMGDRDAPEPAEAGPDAPSDLAAIAVSREQINLTWKDNSDDEDHFVLTRCRNKSCQEIVVEADKEAHEDTELMANQVYRYSLYAVNGQGRSEPTPWVEARTHKRVARRVAPAATPGLH